ncbi:MAG: twin-arginine translocase subunit TatC [Thermoleophilia bacterium]|nr:twin-arginine translocase subunit TatC [Thermoleophilia bacterium]
MTRGPGRFRLRRAAPDEHLSIVEHLSELRVRLAIAAAALVVAFGVLYTFHQGLFDILLDPLSPEYRTLLALSPTEPFLVTITVVAGASILVTLPIVLYQMYAYVLPAVGRQTRRTMLAIVAGVSALFLGGVVFAYVLVLPVALQWLLGFAGGDFTVALRANEYFSFALTMMFAGGLVFEIPVAMVALARMGIVSAGQFRRGWRIAIVVIAAVAAVLPGGDPASMLLLMVPQILLYGVGIWLAARFGRPVPWAGDGAPPTPPTPAV